MKVGVIGPGLYLFAPTYAAIHLATHGVLDNRHPLYSHLLLTKTEGDLENDGLLEAREIMDMNLHADLAVLSACETANGKISPGDSVGGATSVGAITPSSLGA